MLNTEIKYNLSKDYKRLLNLLKSNNTVIGFIAINLDGVSNMEYSKLVSMKYNSDAKYFDIGFTFFEQNFDKINFCKLCKKYNVRYFDINEA